MPPRDDKVDAWMPMFPRDFLAATEGLSAVDGWAYTRLLLHAWLEHGYLPYDPAELARLAKVTPLEWLATWGRLAKFWDVDEGGRRISQGRLLYERDRAIRLRQVRSTAGKKGGETPRAPRGGVAKRKQREANAKPSPSPSPAEEIPPTPRRRGASLDPGMLTEGPFPIWFAAYPLQVDRDRAWRAWQEVEAELPPLAEMLTTLEWQKRVDFARRPPDRVPYPATYLRKRRWTDKEPRTASAARSDVSTPTRGWICPYHRQVPDRPASEQDPDCSACKRLGPRPRRRGSGEATPAADVIRKSWSQKDEEVQR